MWEDGKFSGKLSGKRAETSLGAADTSVCATNLIPKVHHKKGLSIPELGHFRGSVYTSIFYGSYACPTRNKLLLADPDGATLRATESFIRGLLRKESV